MPSRKRMLVRGRWGVSVALIGVAVSSFWGCSREPSTDSVAFQLVRRIPLQLEGDHFIGRAASFLRDERGWFCIPDVFEQRYGLWIPVGGRC